MGEVKRYSGYLAPEYANCRRFSARSDVYSFGVLVLEIVSGRKNNSADPGVHLLSCVSIFSLIPKLHKSFFQYIYMCV